MPTEPLTIRKSTHDFTMLIAGQVGTALLSEEVEKYYLAQKQEVIPAFRRGFVLPRGIPSPAAPVELTGYPTGETDCFQWFSHMEQFAKTQFSVQVNLREQFMIPARLPWKQILPIFIPAGLTNRQMVDQALKAQGLAVGEGTNVEEFTGASGDATARLYLIERTPEPRAGRRLPPKFASIYFEGRQTRPLNLCGYGIGTGLLYKVEKTFLDPNAGTVSWFPENIYLSSGEVACGYCNPDCRRVWFYRRDADYEYDNFGFREAILLSPLT